MWTCGHASIPRDGYDFSCIDVLRITHKNGRQVTIADSITSCLYNDIFAGTLVVSNAHHLTWEHGKHIFIVSFQVHLIVHTVPMQDRMMPHTKPRRYMNAFQWQRSMKEQTLREISTACNSSIHAFFIRQAHHGIY